MAHIPKNSNIKLRVSQDTTVLPYFLAHKTCFFSSFLTLPSFPPLAVPPTPPDVKSKVTLVGEIAEKEREEVSL